MELPRRGGLLLVSLLAWRILAQDDNITCFGVGGIQYPNNTRCPGTDVCCGAGADCLSNRLCHNPKDGDDTLVRGPCLVQQYDEGRCPQVCLYDEYGPLPRVKICADGSMCCEDEGRRNCCSNELEEFFFLDNDGATTDKPPSVTWSWGPDRTTNSVPTANGKPWISEMSTTTTSVADTTSGDASTSVEVTSSASLPASSTAEAKSNDNMHLKIGLGVAIPVVFVAGVLISGGLILCRRRRRTSTTRHMALNDAQAQAAGTSYAADNPGYKPPYYAGHSASELPERSHTPVPVELPAGRF